MKEMYLRLPMVEVSASDDLWLAKFWQKNGRYIVRRDNGDVSVVDVQLRPVNDGEPRALDERLQSLYECFVGQPELFDPDQWVLATDLENAKNAYDADREQYDARLADMNDQIEGLKRQHADEMAEKEEEYRVKLDEKDFEAKSRIVALNEANDQKLAMRRMELENEYKMKTLQLDLETPKRFAQGEWISGKTLTEIIKTLAGKDKETDYGKK